MEEIDINQTEPLADNKPMDRGHRSHLVRRKRKPHGIKRTSTSINPMHLLIAAVLAAFLALYIVGRMPSEAVPVSLIDTASSPTA